MSYYLEFLDRLEEICNKYRVKYQPYPNRDDILVINTEKNESDMDVKKVFLRTIQKSLKK